MSDQLTNREVYQSVLRAVEGTSRTLEEYLRALWLLGRAERSRDTFPPDQFVALLTRATSSPVPVFDDSWRTADLGLSGQEIRSRCHGPSTRHPGRPPTVRQTPTPEPEGRSSAGR